MGHGIYGIRPPAQSMPLDGIIPLSSDEDAPGPMCRRVEDCSLTFDVMKGDPNQSTPLQSLNGIKIGVIENEIQTQVKDVIKFQETPIQLGATVNYITNVSSTLQFNVSSHFLCSLNLT